MELPSAPELAIPLVTKARLHWSSPVYIHYPVAKWCEDFIEMEAWRNRQWKSSGTRLSWSTGENVIYIHLVGLPRLYLYEYWTSILSLSLSSLPPLSQELGYHRWVREENFSLETAAPASALAQTLD